MSALSVGLLALVLLVLLRTDLIGSWRKATPPDAPNRFVINVMPEQSDAFQKSLKAAGVDKFDWYPMIRGRLVAVNGKAVSPDDYTEDRAKRLVDREFNLSHARSNPQHNEIVAGQWTEDEAGAISVEEGIAKTLGLKLGDRLRFDIGGLENESRITSLRKVDWGSMRANFFVMYPVAELPDVPATFMGAFKAPTTAGFDNALVHDYPNITNVDMTSTNKYKDLPQGMQALLGVLKTSPASGINDLKEVFRRWTAYALMGNTDAHAKNWALMYLDGRNPSLAPAYDMVCVSAYFDPAQSNTLGVNRAMDASLRTWSEDEAERLAKSVGILQFNAMRKVVRDTRLLAKKHWSAILNKAPAHLASHLRQRLTELAPEKT